MPTLTKSKAAKISCGTCVYYNSTTATKGECRRHSPQTVVFNVDDKTKFESCFPGTKASDWCGEYAKA